MDKILFRTIERYMAECMKDSAHGKDHIYRVLYMALEIAEYEAVDKEVLTIACLLHDIGREEQFKHPEICHAQIGSEMAYAYLQKLGYDAEKSAHIRDCIRTHRYRTDNEPVSMEARILFDADKLDATGAIGIARTLIYKGIVADPLYDEDEEGNISDGTEDTSESFFHEYKYKLEKMYDKFYTTRAEQIARERQSTAVSFFNGLQKEIADCYKFGKALLSNNLE